MLFVSFKYYTLGHGVHLNGMNLRPKINSRTANTVRNMKFFIRGVFDKCEQIRRELWICSHLLKKSLTGNFRWFKLLNR